MDTAQHTRIADFVPKPLRTMAATHADIEALERETDGLLDEILVGVEA